VFHGSSCPVSLSSIDDSPMLATARRPRTLAPAQVQAQPESKVAFDSLYVEFSAAASGGVRVASFFFSRFNLPLFFPCTVQLCTAACRGSRAATYR
jgi:hypothetical protein